MALQVVVISSFSLCIGCTRVLFVSVCWVDSWFVSSLGLEECHVNTMYVFLDTHQYE